jgi:hypothetical protein
LEPDSRDLWSQSIIYNYVQKNPTIFNKAFNEWQETAATEMDLINPNLSFVNTTKINASVKNCLKNLIFQVTEISNNLEDSINYEIIQQKLSDEFDKILPNILPDSIYRYNFSIFKSPLHILFFDKFEIIFINFEKDLNNFMKSNEILPETFEMLWKNFIENIFDIYLFIADSFWKNKKKLSPAALKRTKIKAAKTRLLSEAKRIEEMESNSIYIEKLSNPTSTQRKIYHSMIGIPGLNDISGKYFIFIKLKLIFY